MPNKYEKYQVGDDDEVYIEARIGYGQPGKIKVFLGMTELADEWHALKKRCIGKGKDLHKKCLIVSADVVDVQIATNWTSLNAKLTGGADEKDIYEKCEVEAGRPINYFYVVGFYK